jgi:hypothetical protein
VTWKGSVRRQVLEEFVQASRLRGARQWIPDPNGEIDDEEEAAKPAIVPARRRRIVTRKAA